MFTRLLSVQWKSTRGAVFLATLVGFLLPIASVRAINEPSDFGDPNGVVAVMQGFGVLYAVLAAAAGLTIAVLAWSPDHRGRHVYALSLPITRSKYAAMRFAAGVLFLLPPAAGVLIGSLVGLSIAHVPAGLHGYPIALGLRFLLSAGVAFAIFFAIAASTPKTAGIVLACVAALFLAAGLFSAFSINFDLIGRVSTLLFQSPGLLAVFTGRWMLVDV
jgi:hypothetical protein